MTGDRVDEQDDGEEAPVRNRDRAERIRGSRRRDRRSRGGSSDTEQSEDGKDSGDREDTRDAEDREDTRDAEDREDTRDAEDSGMITDTEDTEDAEDASESGGTQPVRDRPHRGIYLAEDLNETLKHEMKRIQYEADLEHGISLGVNRHLVPLVLWHGLERVQEMEVEEALTVLRETDLLDDPPEA